MIIVTGGAGFIGSNIVRGLNALGKTNILVVDNLEDGRKFKNIVDCQVADYMDQDEFIAKIESGESMSEYIEAVFHEGACSSTTEWDGRYMMKNNYTYSKKLLHYCLDRKIPFLYASSAAVYGDHETFVESPENEAPLNVYGYSKILFDDYVRARMNDFESQVVGFRYFNVYGYGEFHKGSMASVAYHLRNQIKEGDVIKLFEGCDGYGDGEQRRDFVYVKDVVKVNLWFLQNPNQSGIFNLGTGQSEPFKSVAQGVLDWAGRGTLEYIPFPDHLKGRYQSFTQADITALREVGYDAPFMTVAQGVKDYMEILDKQER